MGDYEQNDNIWHESIEHHKDLTSRIKEVLHQAIHNIKDVKGHLVSTYTQYEEEPESGHHCHHLIQTFADGRWTYFALEKTHRGSWGRDSTTYVRCEPEHVIYAEHTYEPMSRSHYGRLALLQEAGLLTESELADQWALEQQLWNEAKVAHEQRLAVDDAERAERKAQRAEQEFQRMLKKKGLRVVPE